MRPRHLIIRADASKAIGTGHIMRCLAVAQAWQDAGGQSTFVSKALSQPLRNRIIKEGCETYDIPDGTPFNEDAKQTLDIANDLGATAIVIDGYSFDVDYHRLIAGSKFTSLAIDDNASLSHYSTDFVLNQNLGFTTTSYRSRSGRTELLLGASYALIRREFLTTDKRLGRACCERILVTLGGSDSDNVTSKVVVGLQQTFANKLRVRVVLGALNNHLASIKKQVLDDGRFEVLHDVEDMSKHYLWADVVIAAGGSSNWEMCCFNLPRIVLVLAENQVGIAKELKRRQIAINLGDPDTLKAKGITTAIQRLIDAPDWIANARKHANDLVDGHGAARCVEQILSHTKSFVELSQS